MTPDELAAKLTEASVDACFVETDDEDSLGTTLGFDENYARKVVVPEVTAPWRAEVRRLTDQLAEQKRLAPERTVRVLAKRTAERDQARIAADHANEEWRLAQAERDQAFAALAERDALIERMTECYDRDQRFIKSQQRALAEQAAAINRARAARDEWVDGGPTATFIATIDAALDGVGQPEPSAEHVAACDPWFGTCPVCGKKSQGDSYRDGDGNPR